MGFNSIMGMAPAVIRSFGQCPGAQRLVAYKRRRRRTWRFVCHVWRVVNMERGPRNESSEFISKYLKFGHKLSVRHTTSTFESYFEPQP